MSSSQVSSSLSSKTYGVLTENQGHAAIQIRVRTSSYPTRLLGLAMIPRLPNHPTDKKYQSMVILRRFPVPLWTPTNSLPLCLRRQVQRRLRERLLKEEKRYHAITN
jgi:hypothetical protein